LHFQDLRAPRAGILACFQALAAVFIKRVRGHGHNWRMFSGALFHRTNLPRWFYAIQDGHSHVYGGQINFALFQDANDRHTVARNEHSMSHFSPRILLLYPSKESRPISARLGRDLGLRCVLFSGSYDESIPTGLCKLGTLFSTFLFYACEWRAGATGIFGDEK
jgi:hypothetical protein